MLIVTLGVLSMMFVAAFTVYAYRSGADAEARRVAVVEAWTNIVIGFALNFAANLLLIPLMSEGGRLSFSSNFWGGWCYTAIALVRQYAIRRWFSQHLHAAQMLVLNLWRRYVPTR